MTYHAQFLLLVVAGWVNRQQQDVIDYLQEENRVLRAGLRGKRVLSKNTNELKTGAPGPFRSSSIRGEPQIRGVSEAMSAIRVLRTRRKNTVQQRDATLPGGDLDPGPGRTWTRTC